MFKITSCYRCLVVFIFLFLKVNCIMESSDPRKNTSLYDVIVTGNIKNQNSIEITTSYVIKFELMAIK